VSHIERATHQNTQALEEARKSKRWIAMPNQQHENLSVAFTKELVRCAIMLRKYRFHFTVFFALCQLEQVIDGRVHRLIER
jgi:hypothetical protein